MRRCMWVVVADHWRVKVIKQDLAGLNSQIGQLQALTRGRGSSAGNSADQEGEHSKNVGNPSKLCIIFWLTPFSGHYAPPN